MGKEKKEWVVNPLKYWMMKISDELDFVQFVDFLDFVVILVTVANLDSLDWV